MAASMRTAVTFLLLGVAVAMTLCVAAEATYVKVPKPTASAVDVGLYVNVVVQLNAKKCSSALNVYVGLNAEAAACAGGALTILRPVKAQLKVAHVLYLFLQIEGNPLVEARVEVDLRTMGKKVGDKLYVVVEVVEDKRHKKYNAYCGGTLLNLNVGVGLGQLGVGLGVGLGLDLGLDVGLGH